jgi:endo-1,4-beta-D-glucanase Y
MPRGPSADAKFLVSAYNQWKARFVKDNKVIRPENQNDTLSEGVAFGMMIAVNMNDQTLFDGLYGTWRSNPVTGASTLMKSCLRSSVGSNGASCSLTDSSATGADEDAAYALLMAGKLWGGTYQADGVAMLKDIWDKDIDGAGTLLPKGGSNYQSPTGTDPWQITSASYFAPSFYRAFASVDTNVSHDWAGVISAVYKVINGPISGSNGLIPAWCGNSCTIAASNGGSNDFDYQYDSHRIPMRIGLDYCFNGTAEAKIYADLTTKFFAGLGKAGLGIGQIADMYAPTGSRVGSTSANSASVLGTAAVGAMATGEQTFLNDAYQTVFDLATRGTMAPRLYQDPTPSPNPQPTYSYYNATVGMLTLLILTGNFMH